MLFQTVIVIHSVSIILLPYPYSILLFSSLHHTLPITQKNNNQKSIIAEVDLVTIFNTSTNSSEL